MPSPSLASAGVTSGFSATPSVTKTVTAGNMLVAHAYAGHNSVFAAGNLTDNKGNTWTSINIWNGTFTSSQAAWVCLSAEGGSTTISLMPSNIGVDGTANLIVEEISGGTSIDGTGNATINSGTPNVTSGNITTTIANDLLLGFTANDVSSVGITPGTGFTLDVSAGGLIASEYQAVSSTGTYAATFTLSSPAECGVCIVAVAGPVGTVGNVKWNYPPNKDFNGTLHVGIVGFHPSGIGSAAFTINGGAPIAVSNLATNPDSGTVEFYITLHASDYADGAVTLGATYTPVSGIATTLPTLTLYANSSGSLPSVVRYMSPTGTGDGTTIGNPAGGDIMDMVATIAALPGQSGNPDGAHIYLLAGSYPARSSQTSQRYPGTSRYVTVESAPGLARSQVIITGTTPNSISSNDGFVVQYLTWRNVTVTGLLLGCPTGFVTSNITYENVGFSGTGPSFSFMDDTGSLLYFLNGTSFENCQQGPSNALLVRGTTATNIGESGWRACQAVLDSTVDAINPQSFLGTFHPDIYVHTSNPNGVILFNCDSRGNSNCAGMRLQNSATDVYLIANYFDATGGIYVWEMERPYVNVYSRSNTLIAGTIYDGTFSASDVFLDNTPNNPGAFTGVTIRSIAPAPPIDPIATSGNGVHLTWKCWSGDQTSCQIQRALDSGFTSGVTTFNVSGSGSPASFGVSSRYSYQDGTAQIGTTYYYRILAANSTGNSAYSITALAVGGGGIVGSQRIRIGIGIGL